MFASLREKHRAEVLYERRRAGPARWRLTVPLSSEDFPLHTAPAIHRLSSNEMYDESVWVNSLERGTRSGIREARDRHDTPEAGLCSTRLIERLGKMPHRHRLRKVSPNNTGPSTFSPCRPLELRSLMIFRAETSFIQRGSYKRRTTSIGGNKQRVCRI